MQYLRDKISFCVKLISSHKKIGMKLFQIITTTFFVLFSHFLTGQNFVQDMAKQACSCVEHDTSASIEKKVQNCMSANIAQNAQKMPKDAFDVTKLQSLLFDIKMKVYTECEYVILKQKEEREKIYHGSSSDKAADEFDKGNKYLLKKDYEKALPFFLKAVEADSNFVEAFDHIALCYRNKNDLKNAEFYYKKSLQIEPKGLTAVQNLAVVYSFQKKPQQALEQYQRLMMADMSNPEAYYGIAHLLLENNSNLPRAIEYTDIALKIYRITNDPNYNDGIFMKGLIYYFSDDTKNAKKYLLEAKSKGATIPTEIAQKLKIK